MFRKELDVLIRTKVPFELGFFMIFTIFKDSTFQKIYYRYYEQFFSALLLILQHSFLAMTRVKYSDHIRLLLPDGIKHQDRKKREIKPNKFVMAMLQLYDDEGYRDLQNLGIT